MQFLRQIWPQEHLEHLAPRAALLIEGAAFQKIARVDPTKLRSVDGVLNLIEALGGQWGKTDTEDRYDLFERALYMVAQKQDETNDSYLARHDIAFEDLLAKSISINDVRAYVLIRQSALSSEDRKKIIMDNGGQLTYDSARKSLRLLGSRFFQDLQGNRNIQGKKTYDAYAAEDEEHVNFSSPDGEAMDIDEEGIFQLMAEQGDEDAVFMSDFEDQVVEAVQDSPELAAIFVSYQEARASPGTGPSQGLLASQGPRQEGAQEGQGRWWWSQHLLYGRQEKVVGRQDSKFDVQNLRPAGPLEERVSSKSRRSQGRDDQYDGRAGDHGRVEHDRGRRSASRRCYVMAGDRGSKRTWESNKSWKGVWLFWLFWGTWHGHQGFHWNAPKQTHVLL